MMDYRKRFYRRWQNPEDLTPFSVQCDQTDLMVYAKTDLSEATYSLVKKYRKELQETIVKNPTFLTSLIPLEIETPYLMISQMMEKARLAGVGPMAGVAGALAEFVGRELLESSEELIIENGGDIFMRSIKDRTALVYAGEVSPFRDRVRLLLRGKDAPFGVCTSSRSVGHSQSFGNTDAVVVIASSAITADVFATAIGNRVKRPDDIDSAFDLIRSCSEITGILVLIGDRMAVAGEIELT